NTQIYIVDKFTNIQPIGVIGELCIAGINVGQGYLNNLDLTAEKFIDNPFGEGKLYKTGDLAYLREDGNIVYVGRNDFQVKIRGLRIELGEIEAVITTVDAVESVAVVINRSGANNTLAAFYTGKTDCTEEIKNICSNKLPKYMVPKAIVRLDKLPLNQSGKLDRKALAEKEIKVNEVKNEAPINDTESLICKTFEKYLGEKNLDRNSDFFDNGGDSLLMISVLSEKGFEHITSAEFMRNSTPAKLALIMQRQKTVTLDYLEPIFMPKNAAKAFILLPFAGGNAEAYTNFVSSLKRRFTDTEIYFMRYLHSIKECENAAKEIADNLNDKEIYFYSHCVGSAVALQILGTLEKEDVSVKRYFIGASIPPAKPTNKNIWNIVPDFILKRILINAGSYLGSLPNKKAGEILNQFRKDTDFACEIYTKTDLKLHTPINIIISKKDLFSKNYKEAEILWKNYFVNISGIDFIDTKNHYFQSSHSEKLTDIIESI
ncbi:MAG: hypothetical protein ACI4GC_05020, partial [Acutalibacteraceae bacterium]